MLITKPFGSWRRRFSLVDEFYWEHRHNIPQRWNIDLTSHAREIPSFLHLWNPDSAKIVDFPRNIINIQQNWEKSLGKFGPKWQRNVVPPSSPWRKRPRNHPNSRPRSWRLRSAPRRSPDPGAGPAGPEVLGGFCWDLMGISWDILRWAMELVN